jgi:SAM-dependent methyltransferase
VKVCAACGSARTSDAWECADCGSKPARIDGTVAFAPSLAEGRPAFREDYFRDLAAAEAGSFWYRARNDLITWAITEHFPELQTFLEIGCGTGFALRSVRAAFPHAELMGSEIIADGIPYAASRVPAAQFFQMDARNIPFRDHFDVIGAFDVIEHIDEDEEVLREIGAALRPGGGLVLAVPQHPSLWSPHDVYTRHVRRYTKSGLVRKVERAGFEVVRSTSFVSLLLPLMLLSRLRLRRVDPRAERDPVNAARVSPLLGTALHPIMRFESALIRAGVSFPIGGSLLLVARKSPA